MTCKERPIRFTADEVRAYFDGRKTQAREPVKPQPAEVVLRSGKAPGLIRLRPTDPCLSVVGDVCPFGGPGDRLWVRECWAHYQPVLSIKKADGRLITEISDGCAAYKADGYETIADLREHLLLMLGIGCQAIEIRGNKWRPSIHMPRWASRINLDVTAVRVERVQDITEENAIAEGVVPHAYSWPKGTPPNNARDCGGLHRNGFRNLWDSIYAKKGCGWDANPWVWVGEWPEFNNGNS